jgi:hypothetical protein
MDSFGEGGFTMVAAMKALRRVSRLAIGDEPIDAWLSKWGSLFAGLILAGLAAAVLPSQAANPGELLLGLGAASVACSNLALFGVLSRRVHLAWHRGAAPWRVRVGEFLGLGAGLGVAAAGVWLVTAIPLAPAQMIAVGLLALAAATSIMCLGLCFTLARAPGTSG